MPSHLNGQTLVMFAAGLTVLVPYVSAVLTQRHYARWVNETLSLLVSALAGVVSFWQAGGTFRSVHQVSDLVPLIPLIFVGAKLYYVKLGYQSPLIAWIEWLTGGLQQGFSPPRSTGQSVNVAEDTDPLPEDATDAGSGSSASLFPHEELEPVDLSSFVPYHPALTPVQDVESDIPIEDDGDPLPDDATDSEPAEQPLQDEAQPTTNWALDHLAEISITPTPAQTQGVREDTTHV